MRFSARAPRPLTTSPTSLTRPGEHQSARWYCASRSAPLICSAAGKARRIGQPRPRLSVERWDALAAKGLGARVDQHLVGKVLRNQRAGDARAPSLKTR